MFKPFFVCNFCIILNDFSRNPLETFHEGSESVRVNDLLRLNLKLKIAVRKMQHTCLKQRRGGGSCTVWVMLKRPHYWFWEGSLSGQNGGLTKLVDFWVQNFFLSKVYHNVSFNYRAFIELQLSTHQSKNPSWLVYSFSRCFSSCAGQVLLAWCEPSPDWYEVYFQLRDDPKHIW